MFIVDHKNPGGRRWEVSLTEPTASHSVDNTVLARYDDATLRQPAVILAGLASEGTEAASEVLSNSDLLGSIFRNAPAHCRGGVLVETREAESASKFARRNLPRSSPTRNVRGSRGGATTQRFASDEAEATLRRAFPGRR